MYDHTAARRLIKYLHQMKTRHLILTLIIALIGAGAAFAAGKNKEKAPEALFKEKIYDFGTILEKDGKVTHDFEFVNAGENNLMVIDATAECGCTRPSYPQNPIAPGKKGHIKVTFNPAGRKGMFNKTVTVKTNGQPRKVRLKIKGTVK